MEVKYIYCTILLLYIGKICLASETKDIEDFPVAMTTKEPIDDEEDGKILLAENCHSISTCEACTDHGCSWIQCLSAEPECNSEVPKLCAPVSCDVTTAKPTSTEPTTQPTTAPTTGPSNTTTTVSPDNTTTATPDANDTTTTVPDTTTEIPTTQTSTELPTTRSTVPPRPVPPTAAPSHERHFDGASFVGGMILVTILGAAGFVGFKFYRKRVLAHTYSNF